MTLMPSEESKRRFQPIAIFRGLDSYGFRPRRKHLSAAMDERVGFTQLSPA